jgi:hypothetical protein
MLVLDEPALSARELTVRFTDTKGYFVSEASDGARHPGMTMLQGFARMRSRCSSVSRIIQHL